MRYYIRYCDHEGNEQLELAGSDLSEIVAEAERMTQRYDGVEVVSETGTRLWPTEWAPDESRKD